MALQTIYWVFGVAVIALLVFIYTNRYIENKRTQRREDWRERKEEQLQQILDLKKKHSEEKNDEN